MKNAALKTVDDLQHYQDKGQLILLAKTKRLAMPQGITDEEVIINRYFTVVCYNKLTNAVVHHSEYVDREGNTSTSKGGFVIQINKRIKALVGEPINAVQDIRVLDAIAKMRSAASDIILAGEQAGKTRSAIKKRIYEVLGQIYKQTMSRYWE